MKAALLAAVLLLPAGLAAGPFQVRLTQIQIGVPLGDDVPAEFRPMGRDGGVKLSFLVRGEHLVGFKKRSLEINAFTLRDGRQWARTLGGKPNWREESFPTVDADNKLGSFAVSFPGDLSLDPFGAVEGSALDGTITVFTATRSTGVNAELIPGDNTPHDAGPFKVSTASVYSPTAGGDEPTTIVVAGDHLRIIEVIVMDGTTKLKLHGSGSSGSGDKKSYHFPKAAGKKLAVTLRYWTDMKEEVVPFKLEPAKK